MSGPIPLDLPRKSFVAVLLVLFCLLILEAWATVSFRDSGIDKEQALNLTRLVTLPTATLLIWMIVRDDNNLIKRLFKICSDTRRMILTGIAVGFLARIFVWSKAVFVRATGLDVSGDTNVAEGLAFYVSCEPLDVMIVAVIVWWILVPISEEFIHRGVVQSALVKRGFWTSVLVSSLIFALAHEPRSYVFVFVFGIVFAMQYWNTTTLWLPIATHATYDGMIPFDRLCLDVFWDPTSQDLSTINASVIAGIICVICLFLIVFLSSKLWIERSNSAQPT